MSKDQDKKFMISFAGVLALLFGITFGIIVLAMIMAPKHDNASEVEQKKVAARTAPLGNVVTDPALLVKTAAVAAREPWTGEQVYTQVCSACHDAGVLAAPMLTDKAAWTTRKGAAGGADGLAASAIKGKNSMPARGGKADLSDAEIKAAVELMLQRAGV